MNWNISKKLFLALTIIGIVPMIIFSFLTVSGYENLIERQNQCLEDQDQELVQETQLNYKNIKIQTFLIFALLAVFVIFFSIILVRKFIYPIKKLTKGTEELKQGKLNTRINIKSDDEFAELAGSFNKMASQLDEKIKQLQDSKQSIKKAYSDLKAQRERSEMEKHKVSTIISSFSDPIIMVDNSWNISFFNPSAQKIFGFKEGDKKKKVKKKDSRYFSFSDFEDIINVPFRSRIIEKKGKILVEEVVIPSDTPEDTTRNTPYKAGRVKYNRGDTVYKVTTIPVCDEQNVCFGHMKIFYDLTREKIVDELKSEFISIAAHQLRTPLTAIKWAIRMVLTEKPGSLDKEQEELLNQGYKSNERVIKLVNDMLNVSRIEEGRFGYSFGKHDINEVVEMVVDNLNNRIEEKGIKFDLQKPKKIPKIYMDKEKMELVLQNLLENAIKFTPEKGKVSLVIKAGKEDLTIKVKDNGVGIPRQNQDKLFTKFFRAENVVQMETQGTGLGLFITKNIVDKHNGDIECDSEEGKGTEFTVTLPMKK